MVAKLPYDIERDIQPVALVTTGYMLLAASPKAPFQTVAELIDYAKKNPGKLSNASSSNGSPGHVSGELFKYMTGTDIVHIPYKGGAAAIGDLISGQVQLMFESTNSIAPHVKAGRVRALAVTGERRALSLPEVPTLIEAGVPGYEVNAWSGIITTAGVPRAVLDKLNAAVNRAIAQPDTKERLAQLGSEGGGGTPGGFRRAHPPRLGQVGRRDQALRREDRLRTPFTQLQVRLLHHAAPFLDLGGKELLEVAWLVLEQADAGALQLFLRLGQRKHRLDVRGDARGELRRHRSRREEALP